MVNTRKIHEHTRPNGNAVSNLSLGKIREEKNKYRIIQNGYSSVFDDKCNGNEIIGGQKSRQHNEMKTIQRQQWRSNDLVIREWGGGG